ncbi:hypothetical protein B6U99_04810 [Candidatus Geothermarchaeota archaeon ex4572_27]|nr:MAG: hypothetical protein B6U99_04810 [Candidatus Geothermarchaeota archaeon ex4572_27]
MTSMFYPLAATAATGALLLAAGDRLDRHAGLMASGGLAAALALIALPEPFRLPLFHDALSTSFALLILAVSLAVSVYSHRYIVEDRARFYGLLCLFTMGMLGSTASRHLVLFYVFWEFMLIPSYLLIEHWAECPRGRALAVATKYFIFTHLGGALMVVSIVALYMSTGTFDLAALARLASAGEVGRAFELACSLMVAGLAFKVAVFPLHVWLPDAHSEAPAPISAMLSGLMVHVGIYVMVRVLSLSHRVAEALSLPLMVGGSFTLVYGSIAALLELDVKRVLAFSSISQLGYMVSSMGLASALGLAAASLHAMSHGLFKSLLFLTAGAMAHSAGSRDLRVLRGVGAELKVHGALFTVGALALAALPPLNGFFTKELMVEAAMEEGALQLAALMLVGSALTMAYVARLLRFIYGSSYRPLRERPSASMAASSAALAIACALGLPMGAVLATPLRSELSLGIVRHFEAPVSPLLTALSLLALAAGIALWEAYWRLARGVYVGRLSAILSSGLGVDLKASRATLSCIELNLREGFLDHLPDSAMSAAKALARAHERLFFSKSSSLPLARRLRSLHPSQAMRWSLSVSLALLVASLAWLALSLSSPYTAPLMALLALSAVGLWRWARRG